MYSQGHSFLPLSFLFLLLEKLRAFGCFVLKEHIQVAQGSLDETEQNNFTWRDTRLHQAGHCWLIPASRTAHKTHRLSAGPIDTQPMGEAPWNPWKSGQGELLGRSTQAESLRAPSIAQELLGRRKPQVRHPPRTRLQPGQMQGPSQMCLTPFQDRSRVLLGHYPLPVMVPGSKNHDLASKECFQAREGMDFFLMQMESSLAGKQNDGLIS